MVLSRSSGVIHTLSKLLYPSEPLLLSMQDKNRRYAMAGLQR